METKEQLRLKLAELFSLHNSKEFPKYGYSVPHYVSFDSYLVGYATRAIAGEKINRDEIPDSPGDEILNAIKAYEQNNTDSEAILLVQHFLRIEKIRKMLALYAGCFLNNS